MGQCRSETLSNLHFSSRWIRNKKCGAKLAAADMLSRRHLSPSSREIVSEDRKYILLFFFHRFLCSKAERSIFDKFENLPRCGKKSEIAEGDWFFKWRKLWICRLFWKKTSYIRSSLWLVPFYDAFVRMNKQNLEAKSSQDTSHRRLQFNWFGCSNGNWIPCEPIWVDQGCVQSTHFAWELERKYRVE